MNKILPAVFLIVGSIIGAGFASGRELSLFFANFGYNSLYFLPIVFIFFYYSFKIFLKIGAQKQFQSVFDLNSFVGSSPFFNISVVIIFTIYSSAMFAGSVEVLANNFIEVPPIIFSLIIFAIALLVLTLGFKGLVKVNFVITPIIVVLLIVYALYSIFVPITEIPFIPSSEKAYILPLSIVMYVFGNILLSYFIVTQSGQGLNKKQVSLTALLASAIICFSLLICIICLIENGSVVMDSSMPFLALTLRLGEPFPIIFMAILFLGIITSLFSCLHTASLPFQKKFGKKTPIFACIVVFGLSMLGFETIVNNCYPVFGIFGIIIIVKILHSKYKTKIPSHNFKKF